MKNKFTKGNRQYRSDSLRLKGHDYSRAGMYFVTICCQNRAFMFGDVIKGVMHLNDAGRMVEHWYWELEKKYPDKKCHEMVIMPNHFHCVIQNLNLSNDERVFLSQERDIQDETIDSIYGPENTQYESPIGNAIGWFKTMTTNAYIRGVKENGWMRFNKRLWQKNFHERIVRDERAFQNIIQYIINNPKKWEEDKFKRRK